MCVQDEEPVDLPVRRITRSVAANSPKLALPSLYSSEQKMSTPNRKIGTEGRSFVYHFMLIVMNMTLTVFFFPLSGLYFSCK